MATKSILDTIILPYSALGIAITAGIPFILYFLLVDVGMKGLKYKTIRKMAWIFFIVIFIGLWFSRYDVLTADNVGKWAAYVYPVTALVGLIVMLFDGTIQSYLSKISAEKGLTESRNKLLIDLRADIVDADEKYVRGIITKEEHKRVTSGIYAKIKSLTK